MEVKKFFQEIFKKINEVKPKYNYQIINVYECEKSQEMNALLKISGQRFVFKKTLEDVINDDDIINNIDPRTVRLLTYMHFNNKKNKSTSNILGAEIQGADVKFKVKSENKLLTMSLNEITYQAVVDNKFTAKDAYLIGYYKGIYEEKENLKLKGLF